MKVPSEVLGPGDAQSGGLLVEQAEVFGGEVPNQDVGHGAPPRYRTISRPRHQLLCRPELLEKWHVEVVRQHHGSGQQPFLGGAEEPTVRPSMPTGSVRTLSNETTHSRSGP